MSEGFKVPENGPKESFNEKRDGIVAYLEAKIEQEGTALAALIERHAQSSSDRRTREPLGSIPEEVLRDGGSDLSEWRAQVGADAHDREHGDEDDVEEIENRSAELDGLKIDLIYIQSLQTEEDAQEDDARIFEKYLAEVSRSKA